MKSGILYEMYNFSNFWQLSICIWDALTVSTHKPRTLLCGRLGGEKYAPQSAKTQSAGLYILSKWGIFLY